MATEMTYFQHQCMCCHSTPFIMDDKWITVERRLTNIEDNVARIVEILSQTQPER